MRYGAGVLATMRRDLRVFLSYRMRLVSQLLTTFFALTMFFFLSKLMRADAVGRHGAYYVFVVVGIVTVGLLEEAVGLAQLVRMELIAGNFERILISPFGPVAGILSMAAFPIASALVFAGITLGLAAGLYDMPIRLSGLPVALLVELLAAVAFAAIGLLFVSTLIAFKSAMGVLWVISGLALLGGAYFPISLFPGWIHWAADVQPLTPALDLLRHSLVGTRLAAPAWLDLVMLLAFAAVLMPLATAGLWQAIQVSRRRGTIMEY